jgi:DNA-binding MarR family transcriptional regulator
MENPASMVGTMANDTHLILVLGIMLATGILGGVANSFLNEREGTSAPRSVWRHVVLGVVAALTVPLFLNMISSHMIEATRLRSSELFVFAGFCLLYVVVSRRFFENLAMQLMRQMDMMRKDVRHLQEAAGRSTSAPASAQMAESEAADVVSSVVDLPRNAVSYGDIELMRAIGDGNAIYGSVTGLAARTTLPREQVAPRLAALKAMGLIESKIDDKNVVRWYLTPKGRSLMDGIQAAASLEERREAN